MKDESRDYPPDDGQWKTRADGLPADFAGRLSIVIGMALMLVPVIGIIILRETLGGGR